MQDRDAILQATSAAQQPPPRPSTPGLPLPRTSPGAATLSAGSEAAISTANTAAGSPPRNGHTAAPRESAAPHEQPSIGSNLGATTEHNRQQGSPDCPKPLPAAHSEGAAAISAPEHAQQNQRATDRHHFSQTQTHSGVEQAAGPEQDDFLTDLLSSSYTRHAPGTGDMRHDTEGWRCLETSFKVRFCLQSAKQQQISAPWPPWLELLGWQKAVTELEVCLCRCCSRLWRAVGMSLLHT